MSQEQSLALLIPAVPDIREPCFHWPSQCWTLIQINCQPFELCRNHIKIKIEKFYWQARITGNPGPHVATWWLRGKLSSRGPFGQGAPAPIHHSVLFAGLAGVREPPLLYAFHQEKSERGDVSTLYTYSAEVTCPFSSMVFSGEWLRDWKGLESSLRPSIKIVLSLVTTGINLYADSCFVPAEILVLGGRAEVFDFGWETGRNRV